MTIMIIIGIVLAFVLLIKLAGKEVFSEMNLLILLISFVGLVICMGSLYIFFWAVFKFILFCVNLIVGIL